MRERSRKIIAITSSCALLAGLGPLLAEVLFGFPITILWEDHIILALIGIVLFVVLIHEKFATTQAAPMPHSAVYHAIPNDAALQIETDLLESVLGTFSKHGPEETVHILRRRLLSLWPDSRAMNPNKVITDELSELRLKVTELEIDNEILRSKLTKGDKH